MTDILFLTHRVPFPPDRGDKIRSFHLLRALARLGPVHLVALADDARELAAADAPDLARLTASRTVVRRAGISLRAMLAALASGRPLSMALFDDARVLAAVARHITGGRVSAIVAFSSQMAQYVPADFPGRFMMDFVDVDSAKFAAYAADGGLSPMRLVHAREARRLAVAEAVIARRAHVSSLVSEAEAALFRARCGLADDRVVALENGIDTARFDPAGDFAGLSPTARGTAPLVVFTGQMDYRPNIDAVAWFVRHALPRVRSAVPGARFAIVGRAPTRDVTALARHPGVVVTGAVDDVRPWVAAADVVVAPLLMARGIQNKVLEAMAMARPVVASPPAAEGIDAVPGRDLIVAADAVAMADAIVNLVADPVRAARIGGQARARMIERYGWDAAMADLPRLLDWPPVAQGVAA